MSKSLFEELRKRDVKCSGDFSLINWSNADYPGFLADSSRYKVLDDYARWNKFRVFSTDR